MMQVAAVVLAGGYGFNINMCKAVQMIPRIGQTMIGRVVSNLKDAGIESILVVHNPEFRERIEWALDGQGCHFVEQPNRYDRSSVVPKLGSADAVERSLPYLTEDSVLVMPVDMPAWRPSTIGELIGQHTSYGYDLTLAYIPRDGHMQTPQQIMRYGRILRDDNGRIIGIREPGELTDQEARQVYGLNPFLMCFSYKALREALPRLEGRSSKGERCLPQIVELMADKYHLGDYPVADKNEALGVNTIEELIAVGEAIAKREVCV